MKKASPTVLNDLLVEAKPKRPQMAHGSIHADPHSTTIGKTFETWDRIGKFDAGIIGVPFDGGKYRLRKGAVFAPQAIRDELYWYNTDYVPEYDVTIQGLRLVDCGNVNISDPMDFTRTLREIESTITPLFEFGKRLIVVGGDDCIPLPVGRSLIDPGGARRKIGIVHFDGHTDTRKDLPPSWRENVSTWVSDLQEIGPNKVKGRNITQIGIHGSVFSAWHAEYARKQEMVIYHARDVDKIGIEEIIKTALERASDGTDAVFASIDIDVVDGAFAPGTGLPAPGGLRPLDLFTAAVEIGKHPLTRVIAITEISPPYDPNKQTVRIGCEVILHYLAGVILGRVDGRKTKKKNKLG